MFALLGGLTLPRFPLSLAFMFSLLERLPFARVALAHALKLTTMFNKALVFQTASADVFLGALINARIARIAHLSVAFEKSF
jgi:hypothetical protein